tara:strand:+ start:16150 stop:16347 length:198 start_codon:yes stop_codon:yes gene_type:complete
MSKYSAIREQLRVEAGKKYQGQIESALGQIEREHLQDDFCEKYVQLQKVGFHPYDCLTAYMKGIR